MIAVHVLQIQAVRDAQNFIFSHPDCLIISGPDMPGELLLPEPAPCKSRGLSVMDRITVSTPAFKDGSGIPAEFTCSGKNVSPPFGWSGIPDTARSIVVIMDDPDAPSGLFTHWVLYNIPPEKSGLDAGVPKKPVFEDGSIHGVNSYGKTEYNGPCPPPGKLHRYFLNVYALDVKLSLRVPSTRNSVESAMKGHVLAEGSVMGTFRR